MNKKALLSVGGLGFLAVALFLAFGVFGVHTAFIDNEVSEGGPQFDSGATAAPADDSNEPSEADEETNTENEEPAQEPASVETEKQGSFASLKNYSVSGEVSVLTDGNQRFLALGEDFNSSNGPDLKVYLRSESGEFVNLGNLKGNIGDQNYEIPADTDLDDFSTVEIWCERFSVGFGEAALTNP